MNKIEYKSGDPIGELIYLQDVSTATYSRKALFRCRCGNEFVAYVDKAKSLHTKSCGCMKKQMISNAITKHGLSQSKIYGIWEAIIERCCNPNSLAYEYYGARGIIVYDEWRRFIPFYEYVKTLSNYNGNGYSIDRINNEGNYEPNNVRWADCFVQAKNKRKHRNNTSGYENVSYDSESNKWRVIIKYRNKFLLRQRFTNKQEAVESKNDFIIKNKLPHKIELYHG